ncbi:MAG: hypothetical protein HPY81_10820 [Firmicutes bacterium]|nr:hypothetical protein [Bacillota bacterium]
MSKKLLATVAVVVLLLSAGCAGRGANLNRSVDPSQLIKVEIHFTGSSEPIIGYVHDLDLAANGKIYSGGSSVYYLYDANGDLMAIANYQRIDYIKVVK